ncbi:MAG: hypothetical protein ACI9V8_001278 [Urechidicola sp.]|jgi:hypothetical protein
MGCFTFGALGCTRRSCQLHNARGFKIGIDSANLMPLTNAFVQINFFIIGFQKRGTTSLANYLSGNPTVFICPIKESHYFSTDRGNRQVTNEKDYLSIYNKAENSHFAVVEASTGYIASKNAVKNILDFNPDAKFILMIRNPIDMAISLHAEYIQTGWETVTSFRGAWDLQRTRASGRSIPPMCPEVKALQYGGMCAVGEQVDRFFSLVSWEKVKSIFFDEFKVHTREVYLDVLDLIGVEDDSRTDFPVSNARKSIGNHVFQQVINRLAKLKTMVVGHRFQIGIRFKLTKINSISVKSKKLGSVNRKMLSIFLSLMSIN